MTQPEALRLADEMERVAEYDHQVQAAAELRRLHEANEEFGKRQEWWNDRMVEMEAALRQAVEALEVVYGKSARCEAAITIAAAKQALGEQK